MTVMTQPQTIGGRILHAMHGKRMSMRALSRLLDVAQPTVFKWCHDMTEPPVNKLVRIADYLDVSVSWLINGDDERMSSRKANAVNATVEIEDGLMYEINASKLYFRVSSDDMAPTLRVGDIAVVDRAVKAVDKSGIYLIDAGGEQLLRRFSRALDGSLRVSCDNSERCLEVSTLTSDSPLNVIGRVTSKVSVERIS